MTRSAVALLLSLLLALPARLPAQKTSDQELISNQDLYEKSLEAAYQALEYYGTYDDPAEHERLLHIGYRLAAESDFADFPFTFYLVEMPVPNAFALPGGQIFVTRGMLDLGLDDDMLASLLGHEIAHVVHRHGVRMQRRAALLNLVSSALVIGLLSQTKEERRDYDPYSLYGIRVEEGPSKAETTIAATMVVSQLLLLNYSREFEDEADDEGQRLAAGAGFDPAGARNLWQTMVARIPVNKTYGYWRTHPFADSRMRAAETRSKLLKVQEAAGPAADLRRKTQEALLTTLAPQKGKPWPDEMVAWIKQTALDTWPQGPRAEQLRTEQLAALRSTELEKPELAQDYGELIAAYREHIEAVKELTPESPFLKEAGTELASLEERAGKVYPKAKEVLAGGVYETAFLETFLSNNPDAPEVPTVALELGKAYTRLRQPTEGVEHFLLALRRSPESPEGKEALTGLTNLAPYLEQLAALQQLAELEGYPQLQEVARERLTKMAGSYKDIANGSDYLRRFPEGAVAEAVTERLNVLAEGLLTQVLVYQGVGDNVKAVEHINQILAHAPLSPAAEKLREQVLQES